MKTIFWSMCINDHSVFQVQFFNVNKFVGKAHIRGSQEASTIYHQQVYITYLTYTEITMSNRWMMPALIVTKALSSNCQRRTTIQLMVKSGRSNWDNFANSTAVSWWSITSIVYARVIKQRTEPHFSIIIVTIWWMAAHKLTQPLLPHSFIFTNLFLRAACMVPSGIPFTYITDLDYM